MHVSSAVFCYSPQAGEGGTTARFTEEAAEAEGPPAPRMSSARENLVHRAALQRKPGRMPEERPPRI